MKWSIKKAAFVFFIGLIWLLQLFGKQISAEACLGSSLKGTLSLWLRAYIICPGKCFITALAAMKRCIILYKVDVLMQENTRLWPFIVPPETKPSSRIMSSQHEWGGQREGERESWNEGDKKKRVGVSLATEPNHLNDLARAAFESNGRSLKLSFARLLATWAARKRSERWQLTAFIWTQLWICTMKRWKRRFLVCSPLFFLIT